MVGTVKKGSVTGKTSRQKKRPSSGERWRKTNHLESGPPFAVGLPLIYHNMKGIANGKTTERHSEIVSRNV